MNKRPPSITIIGWLFIVVGVVSLCGCLLPPAQRLAEFQQRPYESVMILVVRLLGLLGGVFLLRGFNWARCVLVAWLAFHVILSAFHSGRGLIVHSLLLVVITYFLFCPTAKDYFQVAKLKEPETPKTD
jgi:hypothetical protein